MLPSDGGLLLQITLCTPVLLLVKVIVPPLTTVVELGLNDAA
jgi:hypothetical protein